MGARRPNLILACTLGLVLVPFAAALPAEVHGSDVCATAGGAAACTTAMMAGTEVTFRYTQQTISCSGNQCDYLPTARLHVEGVAPGEWVVRAETWATHYPSGSTLSGSRKELECRATDAAPVCDDAEASRIVIGNPFNSAKWHGEWTLSYVDALGDEHVQATWAGSGWLAQYCNCPG